jgi:hypothetical protein
VESCLKRSDLLIPLIETLLKCVDSLLDLVVIVLLLAKERFCDLSKLVNIPDIIDICIAQVAALTHVDARTR